MNSNSKELLIRISISTVFLVISSFHNDLNSSGMFKIWILIEEILQTRFKYRIMYY